MSEYATMRARTHTKTSGRSLEKEFTKYEILDERLIIRRFVDS